MEEIVAKSFDIEESFKLLDDIVQKLESGNLPMNEALRLYKDGVKLVEKCNVQMDKVEKQIVVLGEEEI
ncbi:MAG: exodeoxyribonuclease VII small subunit [Lachnospira sp.]|nr:exodeoxyribonuclease VII small subunit [Lachnospira sp.]